MAEQVLMGYLSIISPNCALPLSAPQAQAESAYFWMGWRLYSQCFPAAPNWHQCRWPRRRCAAVAPGTFHVRADTATELTHLSL